jgi:hypothetical protein
LLAATAEQRFADGEVLCREALGVKSNHAQLYLNLAEVYYQCGRTSDAINILEKGMVSSGRDFRIRRALEKIGCRRSPVLGLPSPRAPGQPHLGRVRHALTGPTRAR